MEMNADEKSILQAISGNNIKSLVIFLECLDNFQDIEKDLSQDQKKLILGMVHKCLNVADVCNCRLEFERITNKETELILEGVEYDSKFSQKNSKSL